MRNILLMLCIVFLSSCSTVDKFLGEEDRELVVNIQAANNINKNLEGKSSPVELTVFQLSDSEAFENSDFLQLYTDAQVVLKADILTTRRLKSVLPGEKRKEVFDLNGATRFIAVLASFADYEEAKSKAIYQVQDSEIVKVLIEVDGINVTITGEKD